MKAVFIEFLEAFGRACDKISFPAPPIIIVNFDQKSVKKLLFF